MPSNIVVCWSKYSCTIVRYAFYATVDDKATKLWFTVPSNIVVC